MSNPPVITFYTTPRPLGYGKKLYTPPEREDYIIAQFLSAGYCPTITATGHRPEINPELRGLAMFSAEADSFHNYPNAAARGELFCLIYWREGLEAKELQFARGHFNKLIGGMGDNQRVTRSMVKAQDYLPIDPQLFIGGTHEEPYQDLPDGRKLVARVEGGERTEQVKKLLQEAQATLDKFEEQGWGKQISTRV